MPSVCCVADCKNNKKKNSSLQFHRFPKAKHLQKEWKVKCQRLETSFNPTIAYVCSVHFKEQDYARDLKSELMGIHSRKLLLPTAVPKLFPNRNVSSIKTHAGCETDGIRSERLDVRNRKKFVEEILGCNDIGLGNANILRMIN